MKEKCPFHCHVGLAMLPKQTVCVQCNAAINFEQIQLMYIDPARMQTKLISNQYARILPVN